MNFLIPNFADVLDIIILAIIIYSIIKVTGRSTGIELLSVIFMCLILFFIASVYELRMMTAVLRGLQSYWFLIIIIIYQAEIKNYFTEISKHRGFLSMIKKPVKISFGPLLQSISFFSDHRLGALLVFEKNQKLDEYLINGEILDAKLSTKLLLSIFNTSNLFHDGAVIIRNDRIYAAKVVLPLSKNEEFRKSFGTRHLAAIGITEVTDAFCVVVSEQSGQISFTKEKEINSDLSIEELLQILTDETKKK